MHLVINWSSRLQKHQALEMLTKVDFYAFFKNITFFESFEIHESLLVSCVKLVVCILFHLDKID